MACHAKKDLTKFLMMLMQWKIFCKNKRLTFFDNDRVLKHDCRLNSLPFESVTFDCPKSPESLNSRQSNHKRRKLVRRRLKIERKISSAVLFFIKWMKQNKASRKKNAAWQTERIWKTWTDDNQKSNLTMLWNNGTKI